MRIAARLRHHLARRPWVHWLVVAAVALVATAATSSLVGRVEEERRRWGDTTEVFVTRHELAPGDAVRTGVERREVPVAMVPADAVTGVDGLPTGARSRQRLGPGEIVTTHDVVATSGPQALTPAGHVAVAVTEVVASGAATGDRVVVASDGIELAEGVVVGRHGSGPWLAVPADRGAAVAAAAAGSTGVMLLLVP